MAKKLLPPLGREKRKAGSSLPGSLSVYEPKQGKQPKTQKRKRARRRARRGRRRARSSAMVER